MAAISRLIVEHVSSWQLLTASVLLLSAPVCGINSCQLMSALVSFCQLLPALGSSCKPLTVPVLLLTAPVCY